MSTAIEKRFEGHKGTTVEWEGTLERFSDFRFDFVFGEKPGLLATFEVYRIPSSFGSGTPVKAIVHLPKGSEPLLNNSKGSVMAFSGSLLGISAFSKQLFVTDGILGSSKHLDNNTEH